MNKFLGLLVAVFFVQMVYTQEEDNAKKLLDQVSEKMGAYTNMQLDFSTTLINKDAGIEEGDEPPINGKIALKGEKYNLEYLGNTFIFDGNKLFVINHDDREITITDGDLSEDDGFIYPSKLLTFYQEGYNYQMGQLELIDKKKIQFVELFPIDSDSEIIKVKLGIDLEFQHMYQLVQIGENGAITTLTINKLESNTSISDALFQFDQAKYEELD
ncbi:MAG: outer membrane lipoprotein carrier protein LolA [Flavobacteriales bacterium]|nr:outer membrane lipoprotein carrier protein LolA [Flavobacteriales bacterium]